MIHAHCSSMIALFFCCFFSAYLWDGRGTRRGKRTLLKCAPTIRFHIRSADNGRRGGGVLMPCLTVALCPIDPRILPGRNTSGSSPTRHDTACTRREARRVFFHRPGRRCACTGHEAPRGVRRVAMKGELHPTENRL